MPAKPQPKPRPKRPHGSIDRLAAVLKVSKRHVAVLLAQGMPDDPTTALEWRKQRASGGNSAEQLRQERIRLVQEQRQKLVIENRVRLGELVERGQVFESATRCFSQARGEFMKFANDLPPKLEGLAATAIGKILKDEIRSVLVRLSENCGREGYRPDGGWPV